MANENNEAVMQSNNLFNEMKGKEEVKPIVRPVEDDNEAYALQQESLSRLKALKYFAESEAAKKSTKSPAKESTQEPAHKPDMSLKKDMTAVKNGIKSIEHTIKTGNTSQLTVLKSISSKLEEAKKIAKEKATKTSSSAKIIEKLLTVTNSRLTQLIGKIDVLNNKLGRQSTNQVPPNTSAEFVGPMQPVAVPIRRREPVREELEESQETQPKTDKKPYKDGFITRHTVGMTQGLLGRGPAEMMHKAMNATGRFASSLVSRKEIERLHDKAETKKWRTKVLELLGNKSESTTNVINGEKKPMSTFGKLALGGLIASIAAALAYAFGSEETRKKMKDAFKTLGTIVDGFFTGLKLIVDGLKIAGKWLGETAAKIVIGLGKAMDYAKGLIDKISKFGKETWESTKEGAKKTWESTKEGAKTAWNATKDFGQSIIDLPEKIAGALANGAEKLANALYNAIKKAAEDVISFFKAPFQPTPEEQKRTEGIPNGRGAPQNTPDNTPRDKSGKVIQQPPKVIPPVSTNLNKPTYSPTVRALDASSSMADSLEQKERDKQQQVAPIIIDNSKTNNVGGSSSGGESIRLPAKNNDPSKYMLDRIGNTGGNLGQGFVSL